MELLDYRVLSESITSSTTKGDTGIVLAEITTRTIGSIFKKSEKETFKVKIIRHNQYYYPAVRLNNNKYVLNQEFSEHITDLIKHEIKKNRNNLNK